MTMLKENPEYKGKSTVSCAMWRGQSSSGVSRQRHVENVTITSTSSYVMGRFVDFG